MKIYYELPENKFESDFLDNKEFQSIPQLKDILESYNLIQRELIKTTFEKAKFQIMWMLRSLESEIDNEEGMIILESNFTPTIKGFSDILTDKISSIIHNSQ